MLSMNDITIDAEFEALIPARRSTLPRLQTDMFTLNVLDSEEAERRFGQQTGATKDKPAMAARTRNNYLVALRTFCNWCVERDRLPFNPLVKLDRADERSDRRDRLASQHAFNFQPRGCGCVIDGEGVQRPR